MNRLMLKPTQAGYSVQYGNGVNSQQLNGGASRFEVDVLGASHTVNLSWTTGQAGYQYLMAFYRIWQQNPSQPFLARLIIDDHQMQDYDCHFVPATLMLAAKTGQAHTVTAQVEARAKTPDYDFDQSLVDAWESGAFDGVNQLEQLTNVDLPDALENVESVT